VRWGLTRQVLDADGALGFGADAAAADAVIAGAHDATGALPARLTLPARGAAGSLAAEVGYPTSEATSSGLLTFAYNAAALLVLSLSPVLPTMWLNLGYAVVFILCALLMLGVKALYGRTDAAAALAGKDAAAKVHLLADVAAESGSAVDAVAAR
jgi:hypothetical protein